MRSLASAYLALSVLSGCSCGGDEITDASQSGDVPSIDARTIDTPSLDTPSADTPSIDARTIDTPSLDSPSADTPSVMDARGMDVPRDTPSALVPNCDPDDVLCDAVMPNCDEGEAPSVVGSCWGECIRATECRCRTTDDCPEIPGYSEVCYTAGHCGPLL